MSSNSILYDNDEYKCRLGRNDNMLKWILDPTVYENKKRCYHKMGITPGSEVYELERNLVDIDSELKGRFKCYSRCPNINIL